VKQSLCRSTHQEGCLVVRWWRTLGETVLMSQHAPGGVPGCELEEDAWLTQIHQNAYWEERLIFLGSECEGGQWV
jgi:hypothetical protein